MRVSPLNRLGVVRRSHRSALPLLPLASATIRPREDVVIASTSGWAHGFRGDGLVIAYCHSPARWLYQSETYLGGPLWRSVPGVALGLMRPSLVRWDRRAARRPDRYLCNSRVVRTRIREAYGIDAQVVPAPHGMDPTGPQSPVDALADWADDGYLLVVSRLLPYKNVDVAASRPSRGRTIGSSSSERGPERDAARRRPAPQRAPDSPDSATRQLRWVYAHARVLVAPSHEDYGLTPLEAAAFGVPSLTLRAGGYLDTVREGVTGLHVDAPDPELFRAGLAAADAHTWDPAVLRSHADRFSEAGFAARLHAEVDDLLRAR